MPAGFGLASLGVLTAGRPTDAGIVPSGDDLVRAAVAAGIGLVLVVATAALSALGTESLARLSLLMATVAVAVAVCTVDVTDRAEAPADDGPPGAGRRVGGRAGRPGRRRAVDGPASAAEGGRRGPPRL